MSLYSSIWQRKSCREYIMQPLQQDFLEEIEKAVGTFKVLFPEIMIKHRLTTQVKGRFQVQAPHYLVISGNGENGQQINAGFIFEQLILWFDAHDIGSVWLGGSKDTAGDTSNDIIVIGFGRTVESVHRPIEEFKRKPIIEITNAPEDRCIQAVHLAPSGMNTQPWYFEKQADKVLVYKQKLKTPLSLVYKLTDIDMGIALCHYALACQKLSKPFNFVLKTDLPIKNGYYPLGIIS